VPFLQPRRRLEQSGTGPILGARLDDATGAFGFLDHSHTFPDAVRDRFLDIDILAGAERPDGRERVPVVGGGNDHRVHITTFHDPPRISGGEHRGSALLELVRVGRQALGIRLAQGSHAHTGRPGEQVDMLTALAAKADDRQAQVVIRTQHVQRRSGEGQPGEAGGF
jgi:hypothetical protein